jgi:hypothetical protein
MEAAHGTLMRRASEVSRSRELCRLRVRLETADPVVVPARGLHAHAKVEPGVEEG